MTIIFYTHCTAGETRRNASSFYRLFDAASRHYPGHRFLLIAPASEKNKFSLSENSSFISLPSLALFQFTGLLWRLLSLPSLLKKTKPDLVIHTLTEITGQLTCSQFFLLDTVKVQTNPPVSEELKSLVKLFEAKKHTKQQPALILLSSYLQNILRSKFPLLEKNMFVVPPFPENLFVKQDEEKRELQKKILAEGCEYFYCPDALLSTNNLLTLLKAFSVFKKRLKSNMKLVITGKEADYKKKAATLLDSYRFQKEVFFFPETGTNQRAEILSSSFLEVCFTNEEMCLRPQTEAMHCEVPAVVPDTPVDRDTGEEACLYFKPADHQDLSQKLILVYNDENLRNGLIREAEKRKVIFSENYAMKQLWKAISSVTDIE